MRVGIVHPGSMGASIAGACTSPTLWCSAGRSPATRERAAAAGMAEARSMAELAGRCDVIVSVCPPDSAIPVAEEVAAADFVGTYVDANAVAPATARAIGEHFDRFVDGGIVGPPVAVPGTTRLYLSGDDAPAVAALWSGSALDARVIAGGSGAASALKTCYATWTKVSAAMLLAVRALARAEGVERALLDEWAISQGELGARSEATARGVAPKAWRFAGEMEQIAEAFDAADLPGGFGAAAAEVYRRLSDLRDASTADVDAVIDRIRTR